jgi:hypothetical protein
MIDRLVGRTVARVDLADVQPLIVFDDGTSWVIWNEFELRGPVRDDANKLLGKTVVASEENDERATAVFSDTSIVAIDLRDNAWFGPEAMLVRLPDGTLLIRRSDD